MGITGVAAEDADAVRAGLQRALEPDTVILVTKSAADLAREYVEKAKIARQNYIVLEIPSLEGAPRQAEDIARLVSQAIGVKV